MSPRNILTRLTSVLLAVAAAAVVLGAFAGTGLLDATDLALQRHYYRLGPGPPSGRRVLLVTVDDAKLWSERGDELVDLILEGQPSVVALVGTRSESERTVNRRLAAAHARVVWLASSLPATEGSVDEVVMRGAGAHPQSSLAELVETTALAPLNESTLAVHFLTPRDSLPRLDASPVLDAEIPSQVFAGRIVVIGPSRGDGVAVQTPVGRIGEAELYAHALLTWADGRILYRPSFAARWAVWLALMLLVAVVLLRRGTGSALALLGGAGGAVLTADFLAFCFGYARFGGSGVLAAVSLGGAAIFVERLRRAESSVARLSDQVSHTLGVQDPAAVEVKRAEAADDFWFDLAELGANYVSAPVSSIVAEVPEDNWHLEVRAEYGLHPFTIREKRRDIRRRPYRAAYLTLRAAWSDAYTTDPERPRNLIVPLLEEGQVMGCWIIGLGAGVEISDSELGGIERIAGEMARAIANRRRENKPAAEPNHPSLSGQMRFIRHGVGQLSSERRWSEALAEQIPLGMVVSSVWGSIEFVNPILQCYLARRFPEEAGGLEMAGVVARLGGVSLAQAHAMMREVVRKGSVRELFLDDEEVSTNGPPGRVWLSRIRVPALEKRSGAQDMDYLLLVVDGLPEQQALRGDDAPPVADDGAKKESGGEDIEL